MRFFESKKTMKMVLSVYDTIFHVILIENHSIGFTCLFIIISLTSLMRLSSKKFRSHEQEFSFPIENVFEGSMYKIFIHKFIEACVWLKNLNNE